jgi:hypothetical protein
MLTGSKKLRHWSPRHNDTYAYHHVVYKNANTPVRVICPEHGEFFIKPVSHWKGKGCDKCKTSL